MRGTTNSNARGSSYTRRKRKAWLMKVYEADCPLLAYVDGGFAKQQMPTVRCWRCGRRLLEEEVTIDRVVPGAHGGRYTRDNIRPCCAPCNSLTGGSVRAQ